MVSKQSPIQAAKGVKNVAELEGMRAAHVRDGVAMALALSRLERDVAQGQAISEVDVDKRVSASRAKQDNFLGKPNLLPTNIALFRRKIIWQHLLRVHVDSSRVCNGTAGHMYVDGQAAAYGSSMFDI